ncbi:unnamed protein product, partial [Ectocarpus sp. 12 AP-2014]
RQRRNHHVLRVGYDPVQRRWNDRWRNEHVRHWLQRGWQRCRVPQAGKGGHQHQRKDGGRIGLQQRLRRRNLQHHRPQRGRCLRRVVMF